METANTYFTRRARQERASAAAAASAEARRAHLELALRLVRVATEPALWRTWSESSAHGGAITPHDRAADLIKTANGLTGAFPLPGTEGFEHLLAAVDEQTTS
jgi:hypothetical protein